MLRVDQMTDEHLDWLMAKWPDAYEALEEHIKYGYMQAVRNRESPVVRIGQGPYARDWPE